MQTRHMAPLNRLAALIDRASGDYARWQWLATSEARRGNTSTAMRAHTRAARSLLRARRLATARKIVQGLAPTACYRALAAGK